MTEFHKKLMTTTLSCMFLCVFDGLQCLDSNYSVMIKKSCPTRFELFQEGNKCYFNPSPVRVTVFEFWTKCFDSNTGAYPASIPDIETYEFLKSQLNVTSWIGLLYLPTGIFEWFGGTSMNPDLSNFLVPPEGNYTYGMQYCLFNETDFNIQCGVPYYERVSFICHADRKDYYHLTSVDLVNHTVSCPAEWVLYGEGKKCLKFERQKQLSWALAREDCQSAGGDLVTIPNKATNDFVLDKMPCVGCGYWLGLYFSPDLSSLHWVNGYQWNVTDFFNWAPGEPDNSARHIRITKMGWHDTSTFAKHRYICEKGVSSSIPKVISYCPEDWHLYRWADTCFIAVEESLSWSNAVEECKKYEGEIAKIDRYYMERFVKDTVLSQSDDNYWIGIKMFSPSRHFIWADGKNYSQWHTISLASTVSANSVSSEYCAVLRTETLNGHDYSTDWTLNECYLNYKPICQKPADSELTYPEKTKVDRMMSQQKIVTKNTLRCGINSVLYEKGKTCFRFDTDQKVNWTTASEICANEKGHLAKIADGDTWLFVKDIAASLDINFYIGLRDEEGNGTFKWEDGEILAKQIFNSSLSSLNNNVVMVKRGWRRVSAASICHFLCQYEPLKEYLRELMIDGKEYYLADNRINYQFVSAACQEFGMKELFLESDEEFHKLKQWSDLQFIPPFPNAIWLKTNKTDWFTYYWSDGSRVGEEGVWLEDKIGNACYTDYEEFHSCCTMMYYEGAETGFRLREIMCQDLRFIAKYICVEADAPPSLPTTSPPSLEPTSEEGTMEEPTTTQAPTSSRRIPPLSSSTSSSATASQIQQDVGLNPPNNLGMQPQTLSPLINIPNETNLLTLTESPIPAFSLPPKQTTPAIQPPKQTTPTIPPPKQTTPTIPPPQQTTPTIPPLPTSSPPQPPPQQTTPPLPLPPSAPLTPEEKQEFTDALDFLKAVTTTLSSISPSTSNSSTNETTPAKPIVQNKLCPCACSAYKFNGMPSPSVLAQMVSKIQQALRVHTNTLSSSINKKTSAKDDRQSSKHMAYVAVIMASFPFLIIFSFDLIRVYQNFKGKSRRN